MVTYSGGDHTYSNYHTWTHDGTGHALVWKYGNNHLKVYNNGKNKKITSKQALNCRITMVAARQLL